jgi:hypothetical protein
MGKEIEALVIVHLSSLDAYTALMHDVWGHFDNGEQLGQEMTKAILEHPGPVYIIDQDWELGRRESRPREELLKAIKPRKDIKWISFDEAASDWEDFLPYFRRRLRREGITSAILGGVWYAENEESGCVTQVLQDLREIMPAKVNESIVGCESDADEEDSDT